MERSRRKSHALLSLQSSFYHRSPSSPASVHSENSGRHSFALNDRESWSLRIPQLKWTDWINEIPSDPGLVPLVIGNDMNLSQNEVHSDDTILLEGILRKAGSSQEKVGLRPRYFYLTRKFISYHIYAKGPAKGRVYFEDIVGCVSRDDFYFRPQPGLEWEAERAKAHELRRTDFVIVTSRCGYERGRQYFIRTRNTTERKVWAACIRDVMQAYEDCPIVKIGALTTLRRRVRWIYFGDASQIFVATLIMLNFVLNIVEAQYSSLSNDDPIVQIFDKIDLVFTILFTIELMINLFGTLVLEYAKDIWNWFDLIVVSVSLLSLGMTDMPGAGTLRLMRCFRVFRLFKRIQSLRQLIVALGSSIPPMLNAFALVCLVAAIYSIMGTTFFGSALPEYFGDFFTSLFFMFQTMTGDAWSDPARELFVETGNPAGVAVFFVSFQIILNLVLLNVVIAVLLDEFSKAAEKNDRKDGGNTTEVGALDKLAECLARRSDSKTLDSNIEQLFRHVAYEGRGHTRGADAFSPSGLTVELTYEEVHEGLRRLGFLPPIEYSRSDWEQQVVARGLLAPRSAKAEQVISASGFKLLIKHCVWSLTLRELHCVTETEDDDVQWDSEKIRISFAGLKGLLMEDIFDGSGASSAAENAKIALLQQVLAGLDGVDKRIRAVERELGHDANGGDVGKTDYGGDLLVGGVDTGRTKAPLLRKSNICNERTGSAVSVNVPMLTEATLLRRRLAAKLNKAEGTSDEEEGPAVARSLEPAFLSEAIAPTVAFAINDKVEDKRDDDDALSQEAIVEQMPAERSEDAMSSHRAPPTTADTPTPLLVPSSLPPPPPSLQPTVPTIRSSPSIVPTPSPPPIVPQPPQAVPPPMMPNASQSHHSTATPMAVLMTPFGGLGFFAPDSVPLVAPPPHQPPSAQPVPPTAPPVQPLASTAPPGLPQSGGGVVANPTASNFFGGFTPPWLPPPPARPGETDAGGLFGGFMDGLTALGGTLVGLGGGQAAPAAAAVAGMSSVIEPGQGPMLSKRLMGP